MPESSLHEKTSESLKHLRLNQITLNPYQPRRRFSKEELEELAQSIREVGLIQPPVVRPTASGHYELISGERRYRAAQMIGLEVIPVIVKEAGHPISAQAALIENIQRVDLNPMEVARALRSLMEQFGFQQDELAERVGKKRSTVANYLRLLVLPEEIQEAVRQEVVSMGHAKALLSLSEPAQQLELMQQIVREELSVRETERRAQKMVEEAPLQKKVRNPDRDAHVEEIITRMQQKFGTKVAVQHWGKKGRILIDYYNLDDLDRLLEIFGVAEE